MVYSGRGENQIKPVLDRFEQETGIKVEARYGSSAELALALVEEGQSSPADVFLTVDAGALGAVSRAGLFAELPASILDRVDPRFTARDGSWVGVTGRVRVVVYNTQRVSESDLPPSILDYTDPKWKGRLGWTPSYGSFQAFLTALRLDKGEDVARQWVEGILKNEPRAYTQNLPMLEAVANGEIDVAFTNHYYYYRMKSQQGADFPLGIYFFRNGDPGGLINPSGAGILATAKNADEAQEFIEFLLSEEIQKYFTEQAFEYPVAKGVAPRQDLPPLESLTTPDIDLSDLQDLEETLKLLRDAGAI